MLGLLVQAQPPSMDAAANLALRGDLDGSERALASRLSERPTDVAALFVLACISLQRGRIDEARRTASRLEVLAPQAPEVAVLGALVERRALEPHAAWLESFLVALRVVSGKDLNHLIFANELTTRRPISAEALAALSPTEQFVVRFAQERQPSSDLIRGAQRVSGMQVPLPISLAALWVLSRSGILEPGRETSTTAMVLAKRLGSEHPEDLFRRVGAVLAGTSDLAPFTLGETAALEQALRVGKAFATFHLFFETFHSIIVKADSAQAGELAFSAACGPYPFPEYLRLVRRAKASEAIEDAQQRRRIGVVVAGVARALAQQPVLLNLALARGLMRAASRLVSDITMAREADLFSQRFESLHATLATQKLIAEFAIPALQSEYLAGQVENEIGLLDRMR
ncbi:MAG: hypothetical protein ACYCWW_11745 [Deltaproteobacteria bacterium]